ncbi:MAG: 6,7-dimethyl-8-ribityllumazine synthase [Candidatus Woesearchaeota archaeon]|nr:6,7-dimethyl-8-ribityllumazine synthase [Candidatus Woesearchaeota archaeon]
MKLGIVISETYPEITEKMLSLAEQTARDASVEFEVLKVPGAFDIPFGVQQIIGRVDGVVTLGAVIKGETDHDEVIMEAIAPKLIELSLARNKPVVLGINGPDMTREQAIARIPRAKKVTEACLTMLS